MNSKLAFVNGNIFNEYEVFDHHALLVAEERIVGIVDRAAVPSQYELIDVDGAHICAGLVDLQIYGTQNRLFSAELTVESIHAIEKLLLQQGCTSFYLTLATNTLDLFREAIAIYRQSNAQVAMGLHLEGPFLNASKRGAHPEELLIPATVDAINYLLADAEDLVKMITVAPERIEENSLQLLREYGLLISAGHSAATYQEAMDSFRKGVDTVTHLWNAMSPIHHREVGLPGAAFSDTAVRASLIVDGIHVDYEAVKLSKRLMGERLFLITDAVGSSSEGVYHHILNGDRFELPDGTLSGSALSMLQAVRNCVEHVEIALDEALRMATWYPAQLINRSDIGNLNSQSLANILVFDHRYHVKSVYFKGKEVRLDS